ncbi:metallophosphoesterase family protein, partial [Mesorhizobium japonicum]|uniref:metallophosphoesterase family protein n=1 Tax=Mesorhizobium japonicum TaxID=2066070 RepID=UPI003B5C1AFB
VPQRARALPDDLWAAMGAADVVIHAGDWNSIPVLDEVERRCARLVGVRGNNDGPEFDDRLREEATVELDGVVLSVLHDSGAAEGREGRMERRFPDAGVVVFGHSHIPWDTVTPGGLRLLNPGSPTDKRRQPTGTYLTATAVDGELREVELVPLPHR